MFTPISLRFDIFKWLACYMTQKPTLSVGQLIGWSVVTLTSITALAHPHATWVVMYPALLGVYPALLVTCNATLRPALSVCRTVRLSVSPSVRQYDSHTSLCGFCGLWLHCFCPNDQVTLITALGPAHPHATWVAVNPALFWWYLHYYSYPNA